MKWNDDYWKPFGVMNPEKTMQKHQKKIEKAKDIPYNDIIHEYFEDNVLSNILDKYIYGYNSWIRDSVKKEAYGKINKYGLKQIKQVVNMATRDEIKNNLVQQGYPASWDTAFYMAHYKKINKLMERITKEIVRHYL